MLDLSYTPKKDTKPKMSGSTALSMQNVVSNAINRYSGGQVQNGMTPPKTDGFGRTL